MSSLYFRFLSGSFALLGGFHAFQHHPGRAVFWAGLAVVFLLFSFQEAKLEKARKTADKAFDQALEKVATSFKAAVEVPVAKEAQKVETAASSVVATTEHVVNEVKAEVKTAETVVEDLTKKV